MLGRRREFRSAGNCRVGDGSGRRPGAPKLADEVLEPTEPLGYGRSYLALMTMLRAPSEDP